MKKALFYLIALLLPLLLLALVELLLRVAGIGNSYPLFIDNPANRHYQLVRPDLIKRYFADGSEVPNVTAEPTFFLKQKPADGIRLVVQGGSTAAGYPYGVGASLAGMLETRLRRSSGARTVEVVNTALSAVNSYTLLDIADDIIAINPDAVLIYAGHNEYFGIMGVGSTYLAAQSPSTTRLLLTLRRLYSFQLLERLYHACCSTTMGANGEKRTLMARVAQGQQISSDSALFAAGISQFQQNMALLLAKYRAAKVPVYIATVGSNIADQPPFAGSPLTDIQQGKLAQFQAQLEAGIDINALDIAVQRLVQQAPVDAAALYYQLGQLYRRANATEQAKRWLRAAKDADSLRFRAPEAINQQIRALANRYDAVLVDVEARWQRHSPQGLIGQGLMLEHLHPSAKGYFLLADSFYQALTKRPPMTNWPGIVSTELAWAERPLLPAEEYAAQLRIITLTADYPFQPGPQPVNYPKPQTPEQQIGRAYFDGKLDWLGLAQQSARYYQQQRNGDMLLKSLLLLADALPHDANSNRQAASILLQAGRQQEAAHYQRRAELAAKSQ